MSGMWLTISRPIIMIIGGHHFGVFMHINYAYAYMCIYKQFLSSPRLDKWTHGFKSPAEKRPQHGVGAARRQFVPFSTHNNGGV